MKPKAGESPSNMTLGASCDAALLDDASKIIADGIATAIEAGVDPQAPFFLWVDDEPYMIQKVVLHESH